jgi:hypothetical protein
MLTAGQAVVADFGIARVLQAAGGESLTLTGMVVQVRAVEHQGELAYNTTGRQRSPASGPWLLMPADLTPPSHRRPVTHRSYFGALILVNDSKMTRFQKLIFTIRPPPPTIHPACWFANDTAQKSRKSGSSFQVSPSSGDQATPPRATANTAGRPDLLT